MGIENALITFTIGGVLFNGTTDKAGEFSQNILIKDLDPGTTSAEPDSTSVVSVASTVTVSMLTLILRTFLF